MANEKGITLISLTIYLIAMIITVTIITVITSFFYKNVDVTAEQYTFASEFTKIESCMSKEVNEENNGILQINNGTGNEQSYVVFATGNQYTYVPSNHAFYMNKTKVASGVQNCMFIESIQNGKSVLTIRIEIQGSQDSESKIRQLQYSFR